MATIEKNKVLSELESALQDREEADTKCNNAVENESRRRELYQSSKKRCDNLVKEMEKLRETNDRLNGLFTTLSQEQLALVSRVHMLETRSASNNSGTVVALNYPVRAVLHLASKLFPTVQPRQGLQSLFNMLYERCMSFWKHVHHYVKDHLMQSMRESCYKDIKQHFMGLKFLKALDCSTQSLNQECYKILYPVQKSFPKWAKILPEVKNIQKAEYD